MISILYYSIGILLISSLINLLVNFKKYFFIKDWVSNFERITKVKIQKDKFRNDEDHNFFLKVRTFSIFELLYILCGLFTTNYLMFSLIIFVKFVEILLMNMIQFGLVKRISLLISLITRIVILSSLVYQNL